MKPRPFDYRAPASVDETLALLAERGDEAKLLAGGQSLVPMMSFRLASPELLVDLNRLDELDYVRSDDGVLRIGALTRVRALERDPQVPRLDPLLAETVPLIAHPQIRNRGTVGGSLAHADPAAELPVHAVARGARLTLRSARGEREVDADAFFTGLLETALEPDEMVVEVALPVFDPGTGWAFVEFARRHGDYALVGVAALLRLDADGRCRDPRLVFLSVGDVPTSAPAAAAILDGEPPSPELFAAAADHAARHEIDPAGDIHASRDYKLHLAQVLTKRALDKAAARAGAGA